MRKLKRKFSRPMKPWEKQRIIDEKALMKEYDYKNKKEIWRMKSKVGGFRDFAKKLVSVRTNQDVKERDEFLKSLTAKGLVKPGASIDDVLSLTVRDISERRLQTLVFRRGLARTASHSRQLITHGHVFIGNRKVTAPSTIVSKDEEALLRLKGLPSGDTK